MKILKNNQKLFYFMACFIFAVLLTGCKEKEDISTAFDKLPDSAVMTEVKTSLKNKKPIAIAFTAEWCPHCKQYKPIFADVKSTLQDQATFLNIDVDDEVGSAISNRFQVRGIPTTAFIRGDGSVFKIEVGEIEKEKLKTIITELVASKKRAKGDPVAPFSIGEEEEKEKAVKEKEVEAAPAHAPAVEQKVVPQEQPAAEQKVEEKPAIQEQAAPEVQNDLPPQELIKENDVPSDTPALEFPTR